MPLCLPASLSLSLFLRVLHRVFTDPGTQWPHKKSYRCLCAHQSYFKKISLHKNILRSMVHLPSKVSFKAQVTNASTQLWNRLDKDEICL